ncbi:hypothetical protein [Roseovarius confluentis]|uniref:hypothetical protein n=1 Tax=Roseovarius confluentis TaxID=1852027 RepID=UPI003C7B9EB9
MFPRTKVIEAQGAPTNAAMLLGDDALPGPDDQIQHARESIGIFLWTYGTTATEKKTTGPF